MPHDYEQTFSAFINQLADAAGEIALRYFRTNIDIETKNDRSPVTKADQEIEQKLRGMITAAFPEHGIIGEEFGSEKADAEFVWVIDPIDGTRAFMTGKPLFGTIIGLMHNAIPMVGIVDQPFTKERWFGISNTCATYNGKPIRVSSPRTLGEARLYSGPHETFRKTCFEEWLTLCSTAKWPQYGCDCYAYGLLAMGCADIVVERELKLHDVAGIVPFITGAGGVAVDWALKPITKDFDGQFIAATSHELATEAAKILNSGK